MASRFLLCLAVALGAVIAHAGQMSSHVYTAIRAVDYLSPDDQVLVRAHMPAYLAGAQGPDTTGVVQHVLDGYSTGVSVGEDTHYDPKKAELALQVLDCARNDSAMDYSTAYRAWQAANKRAKVAYDLIDAKIEALTDAQRSQLQAQAEVFIADLEKQDKSDAEMEKAMMAKQVELLGTVGLKLTPEHLALIDAERAADAERERKSTSRYCAIGKFIVQPCQLMLDVPNGWQEEACDITETLRRSLTKAITTRNADGTPLMAASASVDITCTDAADAEKKFQTQKAGTRDERSALTIGGYTGPCYTNTEAMGDDESVLRLDALLLRGGLYVRVRISVHSRGYLITAGNTVITDGRGVASATYGTLCAEANALLASFRLPARPTPEK